MKKILASLLLLSVAVGYADGQTALTGNKFADNWAIGVNAGGTTPLTHHSFFKNMRPVVGVHVDKYLTPAFGLSLEAMGSFNTTGSKTAFDASNVSLLGLVNLGNLFAGYNGAPRLFEVEAVAGIGWLHYYVNSGMGEDRNSMSSKLGLNFNFNLGESKAWTLAVKPALVYDIVRNDQPAKQVYVSAEELKEALIQKKMADTPSKPQTVIKRGGKNGIVEIDLHIGELLDDTCGMSNSEILNYQLDKFREVMEQYKKKREQRIVFIHGKGDGVLRKALLDELKRKYPDCRHQDASFQEYGFGATMVTIK